MKQLLFLLLFPCLAWAQYPSNGNQKITLGEQTTADGLVYRGLAADTIRKPSVDTMAFILLDTNTNLLWHYKTASNGWIQAGGSVFDTTSIKYVNTYGTQTVNGAKTFTSAVTATRFNPTASTATGTGMYLPAANTLGFSTNGVNQQTLHPNGLTIFKPTPQNLSSTFRLLEIGAQGSIYSAPGAPSRFNEHMFALGYYWDASGNPRYMNTETILTHQPIRLTLYQGSFNIDNSVVGTKDSIITFTRLLTLNELGKLGIGESSPTEKLHVVGNGLFTNTLSGKSIRSSGVGTFGFNTANNGEFQIYATAADGIIFAGRGSNNDCVITNQSGSDVFTIPTNTINVKFQSLVGEGSRTVEAGANGILSAPVSSITTKENVQTLNYGLNEILQINPVSFDYINKDNWGDKRKLGFIVEDMFPVVPEVTGTMNNGDMYLDMTKLIPILTKAIQEQQALIKALEQRILILENK